MRKRRWTGMVVGGMIMTGFLYLWTCAAERDAHYTPEYPKEDITSYLEKSILQTEDYDILYYQTGLSRVAVDALCHESRKKVLLKVQEHFFQEPEIRCECHFFVFREEIALPEKNEIIPVVEDGDILITFNTHFFGWRNGHAGIVVDAEKGLTLEALSVGRDSSILSLDSWAERPSFVVLRLKNTSKELRAEIATYAREHLVDLPYHLTAGIRQDDRIFHESVSGTQCAHLVWYAYEQFGYDLDSDGGWIVTPGDLYNSPLLEVVQVFGMRIT